MELSDVQKYTAGCINGEPAACMRSCPLGLDVRALLESARNGKWKAAYRQMRDAMIFPDVTVKLCPGYCMEECSLKDCGGAVRVGDIEETVLREVRSKDPKKYNIPAKEARVAIIGAGISGLACAQRLAVKKYPVTVWDVNDSLGGSLLGSPEFTDALPDLGRQLMHEKIEFRLGERVESLDDIDAETLYIATGNGGTTFGLDIDTVTLATDRKGVFAGGELIGRSPLEALIDGIEASVQMETYLLTGNVSDRPVRKEKQSGPCFRPAPDIDVPAAICASDEGYTAEQAMEEAGRCIKCDCRICIDRCELLRKYNRTPAQITRAIVQDSVNNVDIAKRTMTRQLYSCNMCGFCTSQCPSEADIGGAFLFARQERVESGTVPPAFHDYWLRQFRFFQDEAAAYIPPVNEESGYMFFPGCQLGASEPDRVLIAFRKLRESCGAGLMLTCCGAPALWAGEDGLTSEWTDHLRKLWEDAGKPTLILACASCEKQFARVLPEITCVSLYEVLSSDEEAFKTAGGNAKMAVFDPCSARADSAMRSSVRELAEKCGVSLSELKYNNENAKCCGWGGHIQMIDHELFDEIVEERSSASDLPYLVYCANCRDVFAAKGKPAQHVLDLCFGLGDASSPAPTIKMKHDNALRLKASLYEEYMGQQISKETDSEGVRLIFPDEVIARMERLLISEDDVRAAVEPAVSNGTGAEDPETGLCYSCAEIGAIMVWAGYRDNGDRSVTVESVYCHRMKIKD